MAGKIVPHLLKVSVYFEVFPYIYRIPWLAAEFGVNSPWRWAPLRRKLLATGILYENTTSRTQLFKDQAARQSQERRRIQIGTIGNHQPAAGRNLLLLATIGKFAAVHDT